MASSELVEFLTSFISPSPELLLLLETKRPLRVKLGLDPTAPDLHLGHLVVLSVLRQFQIAGHLPVLIIGDHTALIGDPSGRKTLRPRLNQKQVAFNAQTYLEQVSLILDSKQVEVHFNSEWLASLSSAEHLELLGSATLQQVLQREDFAKRLSSGTPIGAHELMYPFYQAYDSIQVHADIEIGGSDQLFNLLFGRQVQGVFGQKPQEVLTLPLLVGLDGVQKMSKTANNAIGVTEEAGEMFGLLMSIPDTLVGEYLRLASGLSPASISTAMGFSLRDRKAFLATAVVSRLHGRPSANRASQEFDRKFKYHLPPEEIQEVKLNQSWDLPEVLVQSGLAKTRSVARRLIEGDGVRINEVKAELGASIGVGDVVSVGRRRFIRLTSQSDPSLI